LATACRWHARHHDPPVESCSPEARFLILNQLGCEADCGVKVSRGRVLVPLDSALRPESRSRSRRVVDCEPRFRTATLRLQRYGPRITLKWGEFMNGYR